MAIPPSCNIICFCKPILFAICASTFSKLYKIYTLSCRVCHTFSEISSTFDAHLLFFCWVCHKIASGQTHDSRWKDVKNQQVHPAEWNCAHWLSQDILVLSLTVASTHVQKTAPVPEITDTTSYNLWDTVPLRTYPQVCFLQ
jgi:hypothetical protein